MISELPSLLSVNDSESTLSSSVAIVCSLCCVVSPPWRGWEGCCACSRSQGAGNNSKEASGVTVMYKWGKLGPHVGVLFLRDDILTFAQVCSL